jgi:hypothetical protein
LTAIGCQRMPPRLLRWPSKCRPLRKRKLLIPVIAAVIVHRTFIQSGEP